MKKRRFLACLMAAAMTACVPVTAAAAADEIQVFVDGQKLSFDQKPVVQNGRTLVPMRAIFEALGSEIEWNQAEKKVTAFWGINRLELSIGSCEISMGDGSVVTIDVPAQVMNGRTLVPLRAVSQCMGAEVLWDGSAKTININRPAAYNRFYQNSEYLFEYTAPEGFYVAWEPEAMDGCWLTHETDPVNIAVYGGDFSGELKDLFNYYFELDEDALIYGDYIDEYSFGLVSYRDGLYTFEKHMLYGGTEYAICMDIPEELCEKYEPMMEDIFSGMIFG